MRLRHVLVCLGLLALVTAAVGPAVALASGGGSAGDQQYTDPLGSTKTTSQTSTQSQATTPVTTPAPTTAATGTAAATTSAPTATTPGATPTATAASGTSSGKTLPFTGINVWTLAGLGLTLTASGLLIRLRARA
jgi:hypothetical protein